MGTIQDSCPLCAGHRDLGRCAVCKWPTCQACRFAVSTGLRGVSSEADRARVVLNAQCPSCWTSSYVLLVAMRFVVLCRHVESRPNQVVFGPGYVRCLKAGTLRVKGQGHAHCRCQLLHRIHHPLHTRVLAWAAGRTPCTRQRRQPRHCRCCKLLLPYMASGMWVWPSVRMSSPGKCLR